MKLFRIGLVVVGGFILNTGLLFQPGVAKEAKAAFPGYNGSLLINSNRDGNAELYLMNADGSNPVNLTDNPATDAGGIWSPDGTKIVFASNRDGSNEVYVMNADGSNQTRLTNNAVGDTNPYWSPDGTKIGFESNRLSGTRQWYMDADGSNPTCITCGLAVAGHHNASWSPLGDRIVFQQNGAGNGIFTIKMDGTDVVRLSTVGVGHSPDQSPDWTPDGQRVVYTSPRGAAAGGIDNEFYIINADGSNESRLTNNSIYENIARVSPDGKMIGFTRILDPLVTSARSPHSMNIDGSQQQVIYVSSSTDWLQGWQPILNTAPVLATKTLAVASGATQSIDVLTGSTDEENLSASNITIVTPPNHGQAVIESGMVKYSAGASYVGLDSLEYKVCDSFMLDQKCATKTLGITVKPKLSLTTIGNVEVGNSGNVVSNTGRPTFSGQTTPLAEVKVEIHSDPIVLTTTADQNGNWSVTPTQDIPNGQHTVYITATKDGQTTQLDSFVLSVQATIPATGADYMGLRWSGLSLLIAGLFLAGWHRRVSA